MISNIWRLRISCGSYNHEAHGTHEVLASALDTWKRWLAAGEPTEQRLLEVHGFVDTADRAEVQLLVDLSIVDSMSLTMMYGRNGA